MLVSLSLYFADSHLATRLPGPACPSAGKYLPAGDVATAELHGQSHQRRHDALRQNGHQQNALPDLHPGVDSGGPPSGDRCQLRRVYPLERAHLQLWDDLTGTAASSFGWILGVGLLLTFCFSPLSRRQAHDVSVRTMVWSHNDNWMVTGDHSGFVKYWQSNMNNVKMFQAHKEPIRGIRYYCERCWCWRCCCYCRRRRPRCDRCGAASFLYHLTILLLVTIKYTIFILLMICAAPALRLVIAKIITDLQLRAGSFVLALVPNEKLLHNKSVPNFVPVPPSLFQCFEVGHFYWTFE